MIYQSKSTLSNVVANSMAVQESNGSKLVTVDAEHYLADQSGGNQSSGENVNITSPGN